MSGNRVQLLTFGKRLPPIAGMCQMSKADPWVGPGDLPDRPEAAMAKIYSQNALRLVPLD